MRYPIFIFSLLQPVLALPFSILESVGKHKSFLPLFSVALAFSMIAFSLEPPFEYDLYRHYERIDNLKGLSLTSVINSSKSGYFLFDSYAWLINSLGLPKQFFTATIVLASYILVFLVFNDLKIKNLSTQKTSSIFIIFLLFWLSIGFVGLSSGIRNGFANIIVFYIGYNLLVYNKYFLFILGSTIAFLIHPFAAIASLMVIFSIIFKRFSSFGKIIILLSITFLVVPSLSKTIINILDEVLKILPFYKSTYFQADSEWGAGYIKTRNINGVIGSFIISRLPIYIALLYLLTIRKRSKDPLYLLICCLFFIIFLFFNYYTLFGRLSSFFLYFFTFFITLNYFKNKNIINSIFIMFYLGSLLITSIYALFLTRIHSQYTTSILHSLYSFFWSPWI